MTSILYENVFDYFFGEIDSDPMLMSLKDEYLIQLENEYLKKAAYKPYVRRLYKIFILNDETQTISFEMKFPVEEDFDKEFTMNILGKGMMIEWINPIVRSKKNLSQVFAGKEQNFYSQANHISAVSSILENAKSEQLKLISSRSSLYNTYISEEVT